MKILILFSLLPVYGFSQVSPIKDALLVQPYYGVLAESKPDQQYKIPFRKGVVYKEIVVHLTDIDTTAEYEMFYSISKKVSTQPPVIVEQIVDAEQATFSSNWTYHGTTNATGWLNNTISFSNVAGSTVSYTFTGRKIEVYGETLPGHGTGTIKVDNEPEVMVSFKSATKVLPAKVFEKSWPTDGQHTIVLKVVSGNSLLDYFKIYKAQ